MECTWWVASLDEHLRDRDGYQKLREGDANGKFVTAMIWARDRHYHQVPFSIDHDNRLFPVEGVAGGQAVRGASGAPVPG